MFKYKHVLHILPIMMDITEDSLGFVLTICVF